MAPLLAPADALLEVLAKLFWAIVAATTVAETISVPQMSADLGDLVSGLWNATWCLGRGCLVVKLTGNTVQLH